jgi:CDP-paratose 2-epimerase
VFTTNVIGTQQLLARLRPHQSLIFCSTKDVYGQHSEDYSVVPETCSTAYCGQGAYEWSKLIAEHYVQYYARQNGFQAAIFRLSTIYAPVTPGNNGGFVSFFVRAVQNSQPLQLKLAGQQRRDLLYVDDLAHAFEQFINSSLAFGCYNIGGGLQNSVTLHQLVELIANLVGKPANLTLTPDPVTEQRHYVSDCQQLWQELQWQPTISIAEGLSYLLQ